MVDIINNTNMAKYEFHFFFPKIVILPAVSHLKDLNKQYSSIQFLFQYSDQSYHIVPRRKFGFENYSSFH